MTAFPHITKPRKLNSFRALRAIFRLHKALLEQKKQTESAWTNRNHYCKHINIIGTEILGPRLNSFKGGNCSPEAVSRETLNYILRLEEENAKLRAMIR